MYDRTLVLDILGQIDGALQKVRDRSRRIASADELTATPEGEERPDGLCMLFIAIGESLKNLDKITGGELFAAHPEIDWKGAMVPRAQRRPFAQPLSHCKRTYPDRREGHGPRFRHRRLPHAGDSRPFRRALFHC